MNAAEHRPAATEAENKEMVLKWAHQMRRELPVTHPAQKTLTAVIQHNFVPTFPVAKSPVEAKQTADALLLTWLYLVAGVICFVGSGACLHATAGSWGVTLFLIGALALGIAFDRNDDSAA